MRHGTIDAVAAIAATAATAAAGVLVAVVLVWLHRSGVIDINESVTTYTGAAAAVVVMAVTGVVVFDKTHHALQTRERQ